MPDTELVRRAVEVSGLSARRFAVEMVGVDERTLRRWLAGDVEIRHPSVREWLVRYIAVHDERPAHR